MKIVNIDKGKPLYLPNDLRNFNKTFRKDVTYDNIKSHKKTGFHPLYETCIFGKTTGIVQTDPLGFSGISKKPKNFSKIL